MSVIKQKPNEKCVSLLSPTAMGQASAFLWNSQMMIQMSCRGFATAQYMHPEPRKYAYAPTLEAQSFMQPEQPHYAHHPGRFFYIKDHSTDTLFSAPYEPVRTELDEFEFISGQHYLAWRIVKNEIAIEIKLSLSRGHAAELWSITLTNHAKSKRKLDVTPYFPVGYMSWMNQSGAYDDELQAIVCRSVTPYQKVVDYPKIKKLKDLSYLLAETKPSSWEARQSSFEGEGGLHAPSALQNASLSNSEAIYETPTAALQYNLDLNSGESKTYRFIFGPAKDKDEINQIKETFFSKPDSFNQAIDDYANYIAESKAKLLIETPDPHFDNFVNQWLPRQVFYHGDVNRLSTDPQTRNFLQDNMGMSYIKPNVARKAFLLALQQQNYSGAMPDGILLSTQAELKYINQVPHMDHCVWLPICLSAYLDETNDYSILDELIVYADSDSTESVAKHIDRAMRWLFEQRNDQGLNFINQGDWCDPMNMVGHLGRGVSIWLTLANAYANNVWAKICSQNKRTAEAAEFTEQASICNSAVNQHGWDGDWYARGITDAGRTFGTNNDNEGSIFLNPQSWAILSGAADKEKQSSCVKAIEQRLETPYGVQMLSPAFTHMHEDIGRVTQKYPGTAENGSIYNHATAFYIYALYQINDADRAYRLLRQMIPGPDQKDFSQRGQLPVFIPNYYRGAVKENPRTAGRSSQLFNTGTVHWYYRCLIDGLFGVRGSKKGLTIQPNLPSEWNSVNVTRHFRNATFNICIKRSNSINEIQVSVDGKRLNDNTIENIESDTTYSVNVQVP